MKLIMRSLLLGCAFFISSLFWVAANETTSTPTDIVFCAPQDNVYPFYMTENGQLTGINPDLIRQVFNQNTLPEATLSFSLRPWKRCNADLENGSVDMMIGGYDAKRDNVVYPLSLGFDLNESAISTADVCFFSIAGPQMERAQKGLSKTGPFIVGIEAGFTKRHSEEISPTWVELFNPTEKHRMLEKGRVDAIVQVCSMDGQYPIESMAETLGYTNFEKLHPPYLSNPAYVVFSKKFANSHHDLAKRIIVLFMSVDKAQVYIRYQPKRSALN
ncbi:substrate-binding periplasmic protein [Aliiglaciecola sp. M165]|uniref:substrate-binding periplasmic protein n=1 Tax=Aliiglaciecola sp. M165 TaxID=2593649 RepID=UPI00117F1DCA|nr:transporter substrate-binding domain-containing protein [Aliiglaciecola sp. M165]TRY31316.1 amino acid ABC transporter substrate-binding protein [Aliiglaciecola sp. M165]